MVLQTKLTIGEPGDIYEQEADRVAKQVVSQINSPNSESNATNKGIQAKAEGIKPVTPLTLSGKPKPQLQQSGEGGTASPTLETSINQAKSSGQSLPNSLQQKVGQAMGTDFSGVKVHTDSNADTLNRSLSSRAFTTGNHIFFKRGEYNPTSSGGQELITHELTHVRQQQRKPAMLQRTTFKIDGKIDSQIDVYNNELSWSNNTVVVQSGGIKYQAKVKAEQDGDTKQTDNWVVGFIQNGKGDLDAIWEKKKNPPQKGKLTCDWFLDSEFKEDKYDHTARKIEAGQTIEINGEDEGPNAVVGDTYTENNVSYDLEEFDEVDEFLTYVVAENKTDGTIKTIQLLKWSARMAAYRDEDEADNKGMSIGIPKNQIEKEKKFEKSEETEVKVHEEQDDNPGKVKKDSGDLFTIAWANKLKEKGYI
ncbi:DUF4157 domain-containing protein [Lusitaniella coriacea]|uniref:eCIS core domain-containing protein n=1 Tax=Lusitaniella coriacea TaxID=1983105 RepID=UPI003CED4C31